MQNPQPATVNTCMCHTCKSRQHAHFEDAVLLNCKGTYRLLICNVCDSPLFIIGTATKKEVK